MDTVHEGETGKPWFSTTASRQVSRFVNQPNAYKPAFGSDCPGRPVHVLHPTPTCSLPARETESGEPLSTRPRWVVSQCLEKRMLSQHGMIRDQTWVAAQGFPTRLRCTTKNGTGKSMSRLNYAVMIPQIRNRATRLYCAAKLFLQRIQKPIACSCPTALVAKLVFMPGASPGTKPSLATSAVTGSAPTEPVAGSQGCQH